MSETTPNFAMPLLHVGQAAKELTHNEALILVDALLRGQAEAIIDDPGTIAAIAAGDLWIVGESPVGDWAGRANALALATVAGWRFVMPVDGQGIFLKSEECRAMFDGGWQLAPEIAPVASSSTEDAGARAQLAEIIAALATAGIVRIPI